MINLIIGIVIGFFVGTLTGIVAMCLATVTKENDKQIEKFEKENANEKL